MLRQAQHERRNIHLGPGQIFGSRYFLVSTINGSFTNRLLVRPEPVEGRLNGPGEGFHASTGSA